jgi:hypothetical protein
MQCFKDNRDLRTIYSTRSRSRSDTKYEAVFGKRGAAPAATACARA